MKVHAKSTETWSNWQAKVFEISQFQPLFKGLIVVPQMWCLWICEQFRWKSTFQLESLKSTQKWRGRHTLEPVWSQFTSLKWPLNAEMWFLWNCTAFSWKWNPWRKNMQKRRQFGQGRTPAHFGPIFTQFSLPEILKRKRCKNERLRDSKTNCSFYRAALKSRMLSFLSHFDPAWNL